MIDIQRAEIRSPVRLRFSGRFRWKLDVPSTINSCFGITLFRLGIFALAWSEQFSHHKIQGGACQHRPSEVSRPTILDLRIHQVSPKKRRISRLVILALQ